MTTPSSSWWRRLPWVRQALAAHWRRPLMEAVLGGEVAVARRALLKGASPDVVVESDNGPAPALVFAALADDAPMVSLLVEFGADLKARAPTMFSHDALATAMLARRWKSAAMLARRWKSAAVLVDAGAPWDVPIWVLDATSLASAMVMGGVDPSRVRPLETTLEALVLGEDHSLRDTASAARIWQEPQARELLAKHQARHASSRLEEALPPPTLAARPSVRF